MIHQILNSYTYSSEENNCIIAARNNWDSRRNCIVDIKTSINRHYDINQNEKCCYCGLEYGITGRGEIDHIAPKGINQYPQFSFTAQNLAKACQLCNSSSMKHTYDPIVVYSTNYEDCTFSIVHPHLDNHAHHYSWKFGFYNVIISINNNSPKAQESIRIFELDSEKRTRARARQRRQEQIEAFYNISKATKQRIINAIKI